MKQYELVARDAPGRGQPQIALAVRKERKGKRALLDGADWMVPCPDAYRFEQLREEDGASEEIMIIINEFSRLFPQAHIQPRGRRPKPPVAWVFVAHLKSKGPVRLSAESPRPVDL